MLFTPEFLDGFRNDPNAGLVAACELIKEQVLGHDDWLDSDHELLTEFLAFVEGAEEAGLIFIHIPAPKITGDVGADCKNAFNFLTAIEQTFRAARDLDRYSKLKGAYFSSLSNSFQYEFSQGDLERVQTLINELRDHLATAEGLEQGHRQRLMRRLERLQGELHKKMSDLDRLWGLVGDAGVALGKFGTDAKPIVDRIREISAIVWRTQARSEELPTGLRPPLIEGDSTNWPERTDEN